MKVAIIQSNYLPWKGYFDIIHDVDLFIFHDDLQYTKQDWRNRNQIKTPKSKKWITIPVGRKAEHLMIEAVEPTSTDWQKEHWNTIKVNYGQSPGFQLFSDFFSDFYLKQRWSNLSKLNQYLIREISKFLGSDTSFINSGPLKLRGARTDKVINLLKEVKATQYVSGPTARGYIEQDKFDKAGIELLFKNYEGYPHYPQFGDKFDHAVSIIDLLFQNGLDTPYFIWGWRANPK